MRVLITFPGEDRGTIFKLTDDGLRMLPLKHTGPYLHLQAEDGGWGFPALAGLTVEVLDDSDESPDAETTDNERKHYKRAPLLDTGGDF